MNKSLTLLRCLFTGIAVPFAHYILCLYALLRIFIFFRINAAYKQLVTNYILNMNIKSNFKIWGLVLTVGAFTFACDAETRTETNSEVDEAQTEVNAELNEADAELNEADAELNDAGAEANREYSEFSAWVDANSTRAETATEEEWKELKAEYKRREAELDAKSDTWDDDTRNGWERVKDRWNRTENKVQERLGSIDVDVDVDRKKN